jgi:hypothetical protein
MNGERNCRGFRATIGRCGAGSDSLPWLLTVSVGAWRTN